MMDSIQTIKQKPSCYVLKSNFVESGAPDSFYGKNTDSFHETL